MKKSILVWAAIHCANLTFAQNTLTSVSFPKTISVTGSSEMEVIPDEIYVLVDLKEYEKKGTGKIDLEKIKSDFIGSYRSIGLPDSLVSIASYEGYNNNPWWRKRKSKDDLYATISYQVKFSSSKKIDELVQKLDDDATQNFRIAKTSHSKIQEYRKQLKIQAIKAAREKANYLAEAINEKAGEAITITEPADIIAGYPASLANQYENSKYLLSAANFAIQNESGETGLDFRKIKLRFEVNVIFSLN